MLRFPTSYPLPGCGTNILVFVNLVITTTASMTPDFVSKLHTTPAGHCSQYDCLNTNVFTIFLIQFLFFHRLDFFFFAFYLFYFILLDFFFVRFKPKVKIFTTVNDINYIYFFLSGPLQSALISTIRFIYFAFFSLLAINVCRYCHGESRRYDRS